MKPVLPDGGSPASSARSLDNGRDLRQAGRSAERANSQFPAMNEDFGATQLRRPPRQTAPTSRDSAQAPSPLVESVLYVAKLEAGRVKLEDRAFDLAAKIREAIESIGPEAGRKGVSLRVRIDALAQGSFLGAPNSLKQILLNLVSDAVTFTQAGFVEIAVAAAPLEGGRVRLRFEARVSEAAKAGWVAALDPADDPAAPRHSGTALQLHIRRKLVALMGGQMGVQDRPGGGGVFWFEVDLRRVAAAAPGADAEAPVIDLAVVHQLRSVMSESQFAALARIFVMRAQAQVETFAQWRAAPDAHDIAEEAHKIMSSAAALGARRVQKIAGRLELVCRDGDAAWVRRWVDELSLALTEVCDELPRLFAVAADEAAVA